MSSMILSTMARPLFAVMLAVSLFILFRGHNEPGGGFVGGLVAASAFAILAFADGVERARSLLRVSPVAVIGAGLALGVASGVPGLATTGSFLTHLWVEVGPLKLGTTMIFDLGVYLVVSGGVMCLVFRLYEDFDA